MAYLSPLRIFATLLHNLVIRKVDHKRSISAVLLALYLVILTPVGYWHQHADHNPIEGIETHFISPDKSEHPTWVASTKITVEDCSICAHQFSVVCVTPTISARFYALPVAISHAIPVVSFLSFSKHAITVRGPPAVG